MERSTSATRYLTVATMLASNYERSGQSGLEPLPTWRLQQCSPQGRTARQLYYPPAFASLAPNGADPVCLSKKVRSFLCVQDLLLRASPCRVQQRREARVAYDLRHEILDGGHQRTRRLTTGAWIGAASDRVLLEHGDPLPIR